MARRPTNRGSKSLLGPVPRPVAPIVSSKPSPASSRSVNETTRTDDVVLFSVSSLTLDTPLIPFKRKSRMPATPFRFLDLPAELRVKVYEHYFSDTETVLDLGPDNHKRFRKTLGFMRVCRQVHDEASHFFYSTHSIRIFPTYPGKYFKSKKPMLARLKTNQRHSITALELRLGPGWNAPPRGWIVNEALGLKDCVNVRKLTVYVECDPSDSAFKGFRRCDGFYEQFSARLLSDVIEQLPATTAIEFEAWSSVKKTGAMMRSLLNVANEAKRMIYWGKERGWSDGAEEEALSSAGHTSQQIEGISLSDYALDVSAAA